MGMSVEVFVIAGTAETDSPNNNILIESAMTMRNQWVTDSGDWKAFFPRL
jgi:hypothetical protein